MSEKNEDYWYHLWHLDTDLHKKLYINNVNEIEDGTTVSVYGDSVDGDSIIKTNIGNLTIEQLYNRCSEKVDDLEKEVVRANFDALNWTSDKNIHLSKVKNVIKHKVSKKRWKIKAGGNTLYVTNDHSIIIFRDGVKMEVKPSDIIKGDKVLTYNI